MEIGKACVFGKHYCMFGRCMLELAWCRARFVFVARTSFIKQYRVLRYYAMEVFGPAVQNPLIAVDYSIEFCTIKQT